MAGLSVKGDPDGWLDAGRTISTLMTQLDSELADANRVSGAGLTSLWQGPAASAFATDWNARRSRYENLIDNARRVAQAITGYGEKLLGLVQTAANLRVDVVQRRVAPAGVGRGIHAPARGGVDADRDSAQPEASAQSNPSMTSSSWPPMRPEPPRTWRLLSARLSRPCWPSTSSRSACSGVSQTGTSGERRFPPPYVPWSRCYLLERLEGLLRPKAENAGTWAASSVPDASRW